MRTFTNAAGLGFAGMCSSTALLMTDDRIIRIPTRRQRRDLLLHYRIGFCVPVPGVDQAAMTGSGPGGDSPLGDLMNYFQLFTGGNLRQSTIFGLGIMDSGWARSTSTSLYVPAISRFNPPRLRAI